MPDDTTEILATNSLIEAATVNYLHAAVTSLMFNCSGTQIYDPEVRDEGSGQQSPHDQVYYSSNSNQRVTSERHLYIHNRDILLSTFNFSSIRLRWTRYMSKFFIFFHLKVLD